MGTSQSHVVTNLAEGLVPQYAVPEGKGSWCELGGRLSG